MKILGIHVSHDSGAAIIENGKILAAVNEERLTREKMFWGTPKKSILEVMRLTKTRPKDIKAIAIAGLTPGGGPWKAFDM